MIRSELRYGLAVQTGAGPFFPLISAPSDEWAWQFPSTESVEYATRSRLDGV